MQNISKDTHFLKLGKEQVVLFTLDQVLTC